MLRIAVLSCLAGCVIPFASPSARVEGGMAMQPGDTSRGMIRAGAHVVGNRLDSDATWDLGAGYVGTESNTMTPSSQGGYLEGAYLRRVGRSARIGIGPGVQLVDQGGRFASIPYLRSSFELFSSVHADGSSSAPCGTAAATWRGQVGFGTFVDVQRPVEGGVAVVAGLSLRLPAFAGVALVIPGCN